MSKTESNANPVLSAGLWSKMFISWMTDLFDRCRKQGTLYLTDLYNLLPEYQSAGLTRDFQQCWFEELQRYPERPRLLRATFRTVKWRLFLIGTLLIPLKLVSVLQPLLIIFLMEFFQPCSTMSISWACFLAACTVLSLLISSVCHQRYGYTIQCFALQMRIAYQGLIYEKILRLSPTSLNEWGSGQITNLFSNDAIQIETAMFSFNYLWANLLDLLMMIGFLWYFVRYVALIAMGYTVLVFLLVLILGHILVSFRTRIVQVTDERVKIMSEIIKSMRIIKMYCWEMAFEKEIVRIRKKEILRCALRLMLDSLQMLFSHTSVCLTFYVIYASMWFWQMPFDTRLFAVASCLLGYLELSIADFGTAIHTMAQYLSAQKRIATFLLLSETKTDNESAGGDASETTPVKIICHVKQAQWQQNGLFSLKNIVFTANVGDLICITGPVGSGKSSLLQTLSGEIATLNGEVRLSGSFCYVPQESWIFSSTLKNNILFGKAYDPQLFRRVIYAAALETDLAQLPNGIHTLVGDQGAMLSGGQKARVNLARALYRDAEIYLLDDPLSAVDAKVSKDLFNRAIKNYLRNKICVLVTHQIQFCQEATKIIVLDQGEMVEMGTYEELMLNSTSFRSLSNEMDEEKHDVSSEPRPSSRTYSEKEPDAASMGDVEIKQEGSVHWRIYLAYFQAGLGLFSGFFLIFSTFGLREVVSVYYSWWLAEWNDDETFRHRSHLNCTTTQDEPRIRQIQSMNATEWMNYRNKKFAYYTGITLLVVIFSLIRVIIGKSFCLNASRVLHNKMFHRLIRCPISFFDHNPVGRILNRFTKDTFILDEYLPWTFFDFLQCLFQVLGVLVLVGLLNPWSFISALIAVISMLFLRHRFAQCSRDLKRLESISRSPIYSNLSSTIHGLQVIRSYRAESICSKKFSSQLDDNTRASFLVIACNRWVGYRFDWITLVFIALVTTFALLARLLGQRVSTADIALTLSFSLTLMGLLQWTVRQSVEVETQMTSVERVVDYCALQEESTLLERRKVSPCTPPIHWPSKGQLVFENVCVSYHTNDPESALALDHISLAIKAGEKIGIVGRTGAGKSSFIQTLFRMTPLTGGRITIDHIDISTITLHELRKRISIIPQDPILFSGTMRSNLDRFGDYSDAEIWKALEKVQLKILVRDGMPNGLQSLVNESGANLSVGQKQLVCLARAILRKSRILVIDEATANVDQQTDEWIQRAIREQFQACTVLTIAHRLRTVIDSDRILVLGHGKVLEFDHPHCLLVDPSCHFSSLVDQAGVEEAEYLRRFAKSLRPPMGVGDTDSSSSSDSEERHRLL